MQMIFCRVHIYKCKAPRDDSREDENSVIECLLAKITVHIHKTVSPISSKVKQHKNTIQMNKT